MTSLLPKHGLLATEDLTRERVLGLLDRAEALRTSRPWPEPLKGKLVSLLFFETSTRTRLGFHAAAVRLGGAAAETSVTKYEAGMSCPESLEDTIRVVSAYCDLLILRHPDANAMEIAISASSVPVINAGTGHESHPSQVLIDLFAMWRGVGRLEGLRVGMTGNLNTSRSAKSLIRGLKCFPPSEIRLMAPPGHELPSACLAGLSATSINMKNHLDPTDLDVLYMAGCPPGPAPGLPVNVRRRLSLGRDEAAKLGPNAIVLCPLPRIDEIDSCVDDLPQAAYFRASAEGLFVRMAILEACLAGS